MKKDTKNKKPVGIIKNIFANIVLYTFTVILPGSIILWVLNAVEPILGLPVVIIIGVWAFGMMVWGIINPKHFAESVAKNEAHKRKYGLN